MRPSTAFAILRASPHIRRRVTASTISTLGASVLSSSGVAGTQRMASGTPGIFGVSAISNNSQRFMSSVSGEALLEGLGRPTAGVDVPGAMEALVRADCVCFDVDSTVIAEEGINVLADYLGQGEAVAELTKQAMQGDGITFQDALAQRLDLLRPTKQNILDCVAEKQTPAPFTPGVIEFIGLLRERGAEVYLVSGGFRLMIDPLADLLDIPKDTNIYANTILFDENGEYKDFDATEPTSQDMGKPRALQKIKDDRVAKGLPAFESVVMVGDGATDMQAKPPANAFLGFGGVEVRPAVRDGADWFITDFDDVITLLKQNPKEAL